MPSTLKKQQKANRQIRFSTMRINGLKLPAEGQPAVEYSDPRFPGLKVTVSATGVKSYVFRYSYRKKRKSITLGRVDYLSLKEATSIIQKYKVNLAKGIDPRAEIDALHSTLTLTEFFEKYFQHYISAKNRTWKEDIRKYNNKIRHALGSLLITDISKRQIIPLYQKIQINTSGPTANRYLALLSSIFQYAYELEAIEKNPVRGVQRYPESSGRDRLLTEEELDRFIAALQESPSRIAALAILLLLATGMRRMECLSLKWESIDFNRSHLTLAMENTKGKRARVVVLNKAAIKILDRLKSYRIKNNPYVFPSKVKPNQHYTCLRKTFLAATNRAGIAEGYRLHDLRHEFCSRLASSGVSLFIIARLVGHRTLRTTERYSHLNKTILFESSEIISESINFKLDF